jgi:hypothetical protein
MATEKLSIGIPYTLKQNQVYAMPADCGRVSIECFVPGTTAQASTTVDFATFVNLAHSGSRRFVCPHAFFRVTSGDVLVHLLRRQ